MEIEQFLGKRYVLVSHENFEDYLLFLGKGYLARKAALAMRPEQALVANDCGSYTFSLRSTLVNSAITFTPGEEFVEEKPDGTKAKAVITIEGNKMTHIQTEQDGKVSTHVREFFPDQMIVITTADGLNKIVKRQYTLLE
ncbi:fatty acid-binding protein, muscle-like isoform X2 [Pectinophora gossypiella]|uniref:fatty acid-binding protein, muscle-like isoform X2 n=1 Tax=Pectinophora gossypiella TaxID=13191 RepID=UPI00214EA04C|nr:fatty acid-binding protein, muscle-like isoform X2 [Pectinophora gossypiella]